MFPGQYIQTFIIDVHNLCIKVFDVVIIFLIQKFFLKQMFAYLFPNTYVYVAVNDKKIKHRLWVILLMSLMLSYMHISIKVN